MVISRNVTLPLTATNYTLLALLQAVLVAGDFLPDCCAELAVTADDANASPVLKGDATLSDTIFGLKLQATQGFSWGSGNTQNDIVLSKTLFRVATGGAINQVLHIDARII